ncbi:MAG: VanW family protein [Anaerolineales bacterium]|nr:VanW family protein [Anaerolineales bacterium]
MATVSQPYERTPVIPQVVAALISGITLFFIALIVWTVGYQLVYAGRIFPGVSVAGVDLSGMNPSDAAVKLNQALSYPITGKILFKDGEKAWVATPAELGMVFDPSSSAVSAYRFGRSGGIFGALAGQMQALGNGTNVQPVIVFDQRVAYQYLRQISVQVDQPMREGGLSLEGTNVVATPGQTGRELKIDATLVYLGAQLQTFSDGEVQLVIQELKPQVVDVSAQADVARGILSQPLTLVLPDNSESNPGPFVYDVQILANMLGVQNTADGVQVVLNTKGLADMLEPVKTRTDRPAKNAKFIFNDETRQLEPIEQSQTGLVLDVDATVKAINESLLRGEHTVQLIVKVDQPKIPSTITGAELGITELIGQETSYFYGSSAERIQNIEAAAARFHGVLVAPGETFSMGATMGDVSLENGFAEALIIYGGRTIKGVGGGVCQVSTTLFRAAFNAGFPIVERYSHAYRVSYYEKDISGAVDPSLAGLDATVYFPPR